MTRTFLISSAAALAVLLTACGNAPQQPSDTVDDFTGDSPYAGAEQPDIAEPDVSPDQATEPTAGNEPLVQTGAAVARSSEFAAIAGSWAPTEAACEGGVGVSVISETTFERPGRVCTVAELIDAGQDSVTAALLCPSGTEGTEERELLRLSLVDGNLSMNVVGTEDLPTTLVRCGP